MREATSIIVQLSMFSQPREYCFIIIVILRTLETFRTLMETGVPELDVPPMDPIHIDRIDFRFFNLTIEFIDVYMRGFKNFTLEKSFVNKEERWDSVF